MLAAFVLLVLTNQNLLAQTDPLPSWNDGATKKSITDFVARVTAQGNADFVPVEQRIATFVHHTDAEREYAYDRQSKIGKLDKALDEAKAKRWTLVDMKQDWKAIFSSEK